MSNLYAKNFSDADEVKTPPKARVEVVKLNNVNASKLVLEPGWKWSTCIKPTVGGDSCQAGHVGVVISGSMTVKHDDGSEITVGAGDAYYFAPGHDGWVNGDEQCIVYEIVEVEKISDLGSTLINFISKQITGQSNALHDHIKSRLFNVPNASS